MTPAQALLRRHLEGRGTPRTLNEAADELWAEIRAGQRTLAKDGNAYGLGTHTEPVRVKLFVADDLTVIDRAVPRARPAEPCKWSWDIPAQVVADYTFLSQERVIDDGEPIDRGQGRTSAVVFRSAFVRARSEAGRIFDLAASAPVTDVRAALENGGILVEWALRRHLADLPIPANRPPLELARAVRAAKVCVAALKHRVGRPLGRYGSGYILDQWELWVESCAEHVPDFGRHMRNAVGYPVSDKTIRRILKDAGITA